ncbi:hypothetical protein Bca101_009297 [Brassica carinata]
MGNGEYAPTFAMSEIWERFNGLAVDYKGNAYVTNSAKNFIWKVDHDAIGSIFSRSPLSNLQPLLADADASLRDFGLNGIVYNSKGYLLLVLVVQATHRRCLRSRKKPGRRGLCC